MRTQKLGHHMENPHGQNLGESTRRINGREDFDGNLTVKHEDTCYACVGNQRERFRLRVRKNHMQLF